MSDPDMGQFTVFTAEGSLALHLYLLLKRLKYLTEKAIRVLSSNEELLTPEENMATIRDNTCEEAGPISHCTLRSPSRCSFAIHLLEELKKNLCEHPEGGLGSKYT